MTRFCLALSAACLFACDEDPPADRGGKDRPAIVQVDPTGLWHVDRLILRVDDPSYSPYTSTQVLPYGTGADLVDLWMEFEADGAMIATDSGDVTELEWEATGPDTLEVTGDIDWDSWTCTVPDEDTMECLLADPDAELTLEVSRSE